MDTVFSSREAELGVIGSMLQEREAAAQCAQLAENDFTDAMMRCAFRAIRSLFARGETVDLVTVDAEMTRSVGANTRCTDALIEATSFVPAPTAVKSYIGVVKEKATRRRIVEITREANRLAADPASDPEAVLDAMRQNIRDLATGTAAWATMGDVLFAGWNTLEKRMSGEAKLMPSGISSFDRAFGGIEKGEYVVIGARPSVGKSALGAHMALSAAKAGYKVGVVSREMTDSQYGMRFLSRAANVPGGKIRRAEVSEEDLGSIVEAMGLLDSLPVEFLFTVRSVEKLRAEVQKKCDAGELDLLVVDYLQLLTTEEKAQKDYRRVALISGALQAITRDFKIPVIALAQLSRPGKGYENQTPRISDLRESGDIEQDADVIILMHRCETADYECVYDVDKPVFDALTSGGRKYISLIVGKGRQSGTGIVNVIFAPETMTFSDIDRSTWT